MKFPIIRQYDAVDCGPACLKMIAEYYGKNYSLDKLRDRSNITRLGVSMFGISEAAESIGFRTTGVRINFKSLKNEAILPCIVHWNQNHYKIKKDKVYVADPAFGRVKYTEEEFLKGFSVNNELGLALLLTPTRKFYKIEDETGEKNSGLSFILSYLKPYKKYLFQLFLGMSAGSIILFVSPFLNQALVDIGVNQQNIGFVYIIFFAELMLFIGNSFTDVIRSWILLHIGTRINISMISDFLMKLLKLPMKFFNSKMMGDILQRIEDHRRIERLLTASTLTTLFSFFNIIVLSIVLLIYNIYIFIIFIVGSIISTLWVIIFLRKRKVLDFKMFNQHSLNRGKLIHIIEGIEEIKISNSDKQKRWEWESIQAKLFKINIKSLSLSQIQHVGSSLVTQLKNIIISIVAAKAVIDGNITLGAMLAITFIIGQLQGPIEQILNFILTFQDAKIGIERISEIHNKEDEEDYKKKKVMEIEENKDIILKDVSFSYEGSDKRFVLKDLNLVIPAGKVTAIVGVSGSGKTTLVKLLLKFFTPQRGNIVLGNTDFENLHSGRWREKCGVVMQNGYIFSDSIAKNISLGEFEIDYKRLEEALKISCINDFVEQELPLGYMTKIGEEGLSLSQGQTQRLLLSRAVYKEPSYIFLDEATSSLDANNERKIMENLDKFFKGRTVVIVAHRLSTVKNADKIVVLDKGIIIEKEDIPINSKYLIKINLEHGLRTSFRKKVEYYEGMKGEAEIMIKDMRLIKQIFYKIVNFFS